MRYLSQISVSQSTSQSLASARDFDTIGLMKTFNLSIAGSDDIIIQAPDDSDTQREEAFALALVQLQEQITDGVYPINQRVWPCIFCDVRFNRQAELMGHVRSQDHLAKTAAIQRLAEKHIGKKQQDEPGY
jgi:hypothetical protein